MSLRPLPLSPLLAGAALVLFISVAVAQAPPGYISGVHRDKATGPVGTLFRLKVTISGTSTDGCTIQNADISVTASAPSRFASYWYVKEQSEEAKLTGSFTKPNPNCTVQGQVPLESSEEAEELVGQMECIMGYGKAQYEHWFGWKPIGFIGKEEGCGSLSTTPDHAALRRLSTSFAA